MVHIHAQRGRMCFDDVEVVVVFETKVLLSACGFFETKYSKGSWWS